MSDRPWYPWYPGDFRAKTGQLNAVERGAYRELLDEIYLTRSGLPDDDKVLAKVCLLSSKKWQNVRPRLERFFVIKDGYWYHARAHEIMTKQKIINQSFSERGKLGALKRWGGVIHNSLANSSAIKPEMARPMANKNQIKKGVEVESPTRQENSLQDQNLLKSFSPEPQKVNVNTEEHNRKIAELVAQGRNDEAKALQATVPTT